MVIIETNGLQIFACTSLKELGKNIPICTLSPISYCEYFQTHRKVEILEQ